MCVKENLEVAIKENGLGDYVEYIMLDNSILILDEFSRPCYGICFNGWNYYMCFNSETEQIGNIEDVIELLRNEFV